MKAIQPPLLTSIQGPCLTPIKECRQDACSVDKSLGFYSKLIVFLCSFHKLFFNVAVAFPVLLVNSSYKDRVNVMVDPSKQTYLLFSDIHHQVFISGGEFVPCSITSVFFSLIVNPKRSHASARCSTSLWSSILLCVAIAASSAKSSSLINTSVISRFNFSLFRLKRHPLNLVLR